MQSYFGHYWKERARVIDPNVSELTTQLAEIVTRNAASAVTSRISAIRARKLDQQAMNELTELVNDLIADKNALIGVATAFEQELVAQRISDKDITCITTASRSTRTSTCLTMILASRWDELCWMNRWLRSIRLFDPPGRPDKSVGNLHVDDVNARLRLRMVGCRMPFASLTYDTLESLDRDATPLPTRRQIGTAGTAKLKEQGLWTTILRPNHMGTHFANVAVVRRNDLVLVENSLANSLVNA